MKPSRLVTLFLVGILGGRAHGEAQVFTLTPTLSLAEEYDDNVLLTPTNRQADFVTTVIPGLRLTLRDQPWTVTTGASVRGVYYARQPELNTSTDNGQANVAIEYRPTPRFTASLVDTLVRSLDPGEVDPATGIITGRFPSTRNTVTPALGYQLDPLTHIRLSYSFSILRSDSPLAEESDTHEGGLLVRRQFTPRTSGILRHTFSRLQGEDGPAQDAHLPAVGIAHALSPTIQVSAEAGPLWRERPDGSTELTAGGRGQYDQEFPWGRLSIAYDRSARVAGVRGEGVTSQNLRATLLLRAGRTATMELESGVRTTRELQAAVDFLVYNAGIRLDYQILRWLSINAGYRYQRQDDRAGPLDLERNVVFVGFTASTNVEVF